MDSRKVEVMFSVATLQILFVNKNNHYKTILPYFIFFWAGFAIRRITCAHQKETLVQYFLFIYILYKTLEVYIIVHTTQATLNIYCI